MVGRSSICSALTPSVQAVFDMNPGLHEHLVSEVPLGRFGDAETDIGPAVAFLAGSDAGFITGTTLSVDGGSVRLRAHTRAVSLNRRQPGCRRRS